MIGVHRQAGILSNLGEYLVVSYKRYFYRFFPPMGTQSLNVVKFDLKNIAIVARRVGLTISSIWFLGIVGRCTYLKGNIGNLIYK